VTAVAVLAGKASPGATTVAAALTLTWPRPVLLVDADPAGGDVVPGLLPGRVSTESGLLSWSVATRHLPALDAAASIGEHAVALSEAGDAWVMPGLQSATQAGALTGGGWTRLATAVERCTSVLGRDVVVGVGRLGEASCWPVIAACDVVLLVVRPTARSIQGALAAVEMLRTRLGDLQAVQLVVNGPGSYTPSQTAAALEVPLAATLPGDYRAAAALVDGATAPVLRMTRTRLVMQVDRLAQQLCADVSAPIGVLS